MADGKREEVQILSRVKLFAKRKCLPIRHFLVQKLVDRIGHYSNSELTTNMYMLQLVERYFKYHTGTNF